MRSAPAAGSDREHDVATVDLERGDARRHAEAESRVDPAFGGREHRDRLRPAHRVVEQPVHHRAQDPAAAVGREHRDRAHARRGRERTTRQCELHRVAPAGRDDPVAVEGGDRPIDVDRAHLAVRVLRRLAERGEVGRDELGELVRSDRAHLQVHHMSLARREASGSGIRAQLARARSAPPGKTSGGSGRAGVGRGASGRPSSGRGRDGGTRRREEPPSRPTSRPPSRPLVRPRVDRPEPRDRPRPDPRRSRIRSLTFSRALSNARSTASGRSLVRLTRPTPRAARRRRRPRRTRARTRARADRASPRSGSSRGARRRTRTSGTAPRTSRTHVRVRRRGHRAGAGCRTRACRSPNRSR